MSNSDTHPAEFEFPEPFGGVPVFYDLVPSILFALAFTTFFLIGVLNLRNPQKRTWVKFASTAVSFERMVVLGMRSAASLRLDVRESNGMIGYQQITLAAAMLYLLQEQVHLVLCAVTLATRNGVPYEEWAKLVEKDPAIKEERQAERRKYRKWTVYIDIAINILLAVQVSTGSWRWTAGNYELGKWIMLVRFLGNMGVMIAVVSVLSMVYQYKDIEHINPEGLRRPRIALGVILCIPIYRASVSWRTTTTLASSPRSALIPKIAFYLFQLLPELTTCAISVCTDYRKLSDTGIWGDRPRNRIENRQGPPKFLVCLGNFFLPWRWPVLFVNRIVKRGRCGRQAPLRLAQLPVNDDCEKPVSETPDSPSARWLSNPDLSSTSSIYISRSQDLSEKPLISTETSTIRSKGWSTFNSSMSSQLLSSKSIAEATTSMPSSPLVTDVNLWKPRLPPAFRGQ